MSVTVSSLERLQQLQTEVSKLQQAAVDELTQKRKALIEERAPIDTDIAKLSGKPIEGRKAGITISLGRGVSLQQLKEELAAAPDKRRNVNR